MSFRRNSEAAHAWKSWVVQHRDTLLECGVPHDMLENERHWLYFLDHGYFTPAGISEPVISIDHMEKSQLKRLHELLNKGGTYEACCILPDIEHLLKRKV